MSKGRILITEKDSDIAKMLQIYFDAQGYEVLAAGEADKALAICRTRRPKLIILDKQFPGIDDYLTGLQSNLMTQHIPIVYLMPEDNQGDDISEGGSDRFVAIPFDIDELKQQVEAVLRHFSTQGLCHPITNLPTGQFIEEQLKKAKAIPGERSLLLWTVSGITGSLGMNEVILLVADMISDTVESYGGSDDFVGQPADDEFIMITTPLGAAKIREVINQRFDKQLGRMAKLICRDLTFPPDSIR